MSLLGYVRGLGAQRRSVTVVNGGPPIPNVQGIFWAERTALQDQVTYPVDGELTYLDTEPVYNLTARTEQIRTNVPVATNYPGAVQSYVWGATAKVVGTTADLPVRWRASWASGSGNPPRPPWVTAAGTSLTVSCRPGIENGAQYLLNPGVLTVYARVGSVEYGPITFTVTIIDTGGGC